MSPATATATAEYELVLMIDPEISEERRDQIAADARKRIESGGDLKHDSAWGMRNMAYEIRQRTEADYRFYRFETGGSLLDELNHNLRIADGVLRFRIFKVDPRSPVIAPPAPATTSAAGPPRGRPDAPAADADEKPAAEKPAAEEPAAEEAAPSEPPAEPTAEASSEPAPDAEPPSEPAPDVEAPTEPPPEQAAEPAPDAEPEQPPAEEPAK